MNRHTINAIIAGNAQEGSIALAKERWIQQRQRTTRCA
jgi:hypothetical protein